MNSQPIEGLRVKENPLPSAPERVPKKKTILKEIMKNMCM